jgi:DNA ligase-1
MKPMLAETWNPAKVKFPVIAQPKIDGVRALNMTGKLTGRSLKPFKNKYLTTQLSHSALIGFDGELAAESHVHPDLCRITSSATGTIEGQPYVLWWLFDYVTVENKATPYERRLLQLEDRIKELMSEQPLLYPHLRLIPSKLCHTMDELEEFDAGNLIAGYEGTCFRDPKGLHKQGRSSPTQGGLLRIKRFVDFEFKVHTIIEGEENQNEAQINELGNTFRSSHQENMVANGMVGAMLGNVLANVYDGDTLLFSAGQEVRVGAGCLTHDQRRHYFINQDEFKRLIHKAKFFPKGIKDKPRFPTWQSFRNAEDM